ncbi:Aurora kinase A [Tetrabaena socialis]|uniref:Aurora kinase A n=1 Tax=Tetrabaena socialis TaxID=47790 RepID=A0A2J8AAA5_9CHLO|nr:Aurora kinase A [Tetrabaena socialis]|eukprot:PNH09413.1 Aurora kinase A [Tetrabaena socialis]
MLDTFKSGEWAVIWGLEHQNGPSCTGGGHGEAPPSLTGTLHSHQKLGSPLHRQSSSSMQLPSPLCTATATPLARHIANRALRKAGDTAPMTLPSLTGSVKLRELVVVPAGGGEPAGGAHIAGALTSPSSSPRPPASQVAARALHDPSPRVRRATTVDISADALALSPGSPGPASPTASTSIFTSSLLSDPRADRFPRLQSMPHVHTLPYGHDPVEPHTVQQQPGRQSISGPPMSPVADTHPHPPHQLQPPHHAQHHPPHHHHQAQAQAHTTEWRRRSEACSALLAVPEAPLPKLRGAAIAAASPSGAPPADAATGAGTEAPEAEVGVEDLMPTRSEPLRVRVPEPILPVGSGLGGGSSRPSGDTATRSPRRSHQGTPPPGLPTASRLSEVALAPSGLPAFAPRPMPAEGLLHLSKLAPPLMARPDAPWGVADFKVVRKLYAGYASSVYKASCTHSSSDVVLKAYNLTGLSSFLRHQVLRELDIHARLRHVGIVHLIAAFKEGDILVMVQEYVRGGSLDRVRRKLGGRMTEFQTMHLVLLPLLNVLAYLHAGGYFHRDIKPENLLFTEDWQLKVCDFGVSICAHEERAVTRTGSREYMAPEVNVCPLKRGPDDNKDNVALAYTAAADVWSLGVLLYELLVGFTPFGANQAPEATPAKSLAFPSGVSANARALVLECLEQDARDRPTVQQLLQHAWIRGSLDQEQKQEQAPAAL